MGLAKFDVELATIKALLRMPESSTILSISTEKAKESDTAAPTVATVLVEDESLPETEEPIPTQPALREVRQLVWDWNIQGE